MRENAKDLIGRKFGKLTITEIVGTNKHHKIIFLCLCDCGNYKKATRNSLVSGITKSRGCLHREALEKRNYKHGNSIRNKRTIEYISWKHMNQRCSNPNDKDFHYYGGRGIKVCDEWKDDFSKFLEDMGPCPEKYTLDRIDNNGNYESKNCKWSSRKEQSINKRTTIFEEIDGEIRCRTDWIEHERMSLPFVYGRLKKGISFEAIVREVRAKRSMIRSPFFSP